MSSLLTTRQVAELFCVTTATLAAWRRTGDGPTFVKLGDGPRSKVRYRQQDVDDYLDRQSASSTREVKERRVRDVRVPVVTRRVGDRQ